MFKDSIYLLPLEINSISKLQTEMVVIKRIIKNLLLRILYVIYRAPDYIITCAGEMGRQNLIKLFQLNPEKVRSITSNPDHEKFNPDRTVSVETFGIKPEEKVIGIISAIRRKKGYMQFIESMPAIVKKTKYKVKFLIVGSGSISFMTELLNKTKTLGVADKCIFTGYREDIPEMLSLMDIFVLPSLNEGTSQALLQAMAMRLPVISCPVGGITELMGCTEPPEFTESNCHLTSRGILVPTKDPEAISDAVIYLLERPELSQKIGHSNRALMIEKYSSNLMFDKIEDIYEKLLDNFTH